MIEERSWDPLKGFIHQGKLEKLWQEVLPNISYQPARENIFKVFEMPLNRIKVVIMADGPYSFPGFCPGYAFGINSNISHITGNMMEIKNEVISSEAMTSETISDWDAWKTLEHWREQGVFLLNTALTVETGNPGSHNEYWEDFIARTIRYISSKQPCIWFFVGRSKRFLPYIQGSTLFLNKYSLEAIEDIPILYYINYVYFTKRDNKSFLGTYVFSYINRVLEKMKKRQIAW